LFKKLFPLFVILLVLFLDQGLKIWVKTSFHLGENIFDFGLLRLDFVENPGMAFGLSFGGVISKYILGVFRLVAIFFIGKYLIKLVKTSAHWGFIILVSLIFAGALGNLLDNLFYGLIFDSGTTWNRVFEYWVGYNGVSTLFSGQYGGLLEGCVVDMLHFVFYWPSWTPFGLANEEVFPPVFNIADACISSSVFLIIIFYKKIISKEDLEFYFFKSRS